MTKLARIVGRGGAPFIPSDLRQVGRTHRHAQRIFTFAFESPQFALDVPPGGQLPFDPGCVAVVLRRYSGDYYDPALIVERDGAADLTLPMEVYRYGSTLVFLATLERPGTIRGARFQVDCRRAGFRLMGAGWMSAQGAGAVLEAANKQRFAALGPRMLRGFFRLLPFGQSTKIRWARQVLPYSWLRVIDPAADFFRPRLPGASEGGGGANAPLAEAFRDRWGQAVGTVDRRAFGELAVRPVRPERTDTKLIAYYLPQFHPIPENDRWWGRGFTEWTNVGKASPVFAGHYQPRLPGELGYYDLRVVDVMRRQVELAKLYGISAFCFHFYWFGGKRLIELPLLNFLANRDLDLSFSLCWANENWTRRWDGAEREMLISQAHSPEDDVAFIRYVRKYFDDPRYLRIDGKPVLTVYRPSTLPDPAATVQRWQAEAKAMGFPGLYLVATNAFNFKDYEAIGFDAISEFPPHGVTVPNAREDVTILTEEFTGLVHHYRDVARLPSGLVNEGKVWPGVMLGWDNVARMPRLGRVFHGATPGLFREWLQKAVGRARANPEGERFVLVNAWNEWAEGAYLEPDRRFGYAWLAACGSVVEETGSAESEAAAVFAETRAKFRPASRRAILIHLYYTDAAAEIASQVAAFGDADVYITLPMDLTGVEARKIAGLFPRAHIEEIRNRGRDARAFLTLLDRIAGHDYEFALKLHTRGRTGGADPAVAALLSPAARNALRTAAGRPKTGIVTFETARASPGNETFWLHSLARARKLAEKLGVDLQADEKLVPSRMFWFRPAALAGLRGLASEGDFEPEFGLTGDTLAHALSALAPVAARAAGFEVAEFDARRVEAEVA